MASDGTSESKVDGKDVGVGEKAAKVIGGGEAKPSGSADACSALAMIDDTGGTGGTLDMNDDGDSASGQELQLLQYCDFGDFLRNLDIDRRKETGSLVLMAAHHMFATPLPPDWTEQIEEDSARIYFWNALTGEAAWLHPQEAIFKSIIDEIRTWRDTDSPDAIRIKGDQHIRDAYRDAIAAIESWQAYSSSDEEGAPQYFYNSVTDQTSWADPRKTMQFDLWQRHALLTKVVLDHEARYKKLHGDGMAPGAWEAGSPTATTTAALNDTRQTQLALLNEAQSTKSSWHSLPAPRAEMQTIGVQTDELALKISESLSGMNAVQSSSSSPPKLPKLQLGSRTDLPLPAATGYCEPPKVPPERWLGHALQVNSALSAQNSELRVLVSQARSLAEKMKALRAERAMIQSQAQLCMARPIEVLAPPL
eukprot:CAMPEP_0178417200 /NCGR_PEP_ID=MMETSP0689_2-20121128/24452_1 /TAXON_ID=160604 /ORGANISM="Amphidinium massartii, Strain CS-259" /LENGTH=421 /DNA_ID=CAMNT_0020038559 /DNA_START=15 /DNA_END=1277 /DNA_ORIENTATION=-